MIKIKNTKPDGTIKEEEFSHIEDYERFVQVNISAEISLDRYYTQGTVDRMIDEQEEKGPLQ